ncbi:MAG TPA: hypothetical protein DFI00_10130 [Rhodospirillaceae bacterium]|nr:hypothetical protein [Rhodospirillaceae bacterium]
MAIGSSRLTHGGADILERPGLLDQAGMLRPALLSAQLMPIGLTRHFALLDQIEALNSFGLTIAETAEVNGLAFTWYPSQADYRLTRIIYGKAAETTSASTELAALNKALTLHDGARWDAYIAFGAVPGNPDASFLKGYIDASSVSAGIHEPLAQALDTAIRGAPVDDADSVFSTAAYRHIRDSSICDLLGVNILANKPETKLYRMNYDGLDPALLAQDFFGDSDRQQDMRRQIDAFAALGFRIAYIVFTASGGPDDIRVQFFNPDGPPAAALIQQLLDAGLLEHTGRHDALINCLAGSRLRSWHVVAGNQPGAAQRLKIYADLPHLLPIWQTPKIRAVTR